MIYNLQSIQSGGVSPDRVKEPVPYWFLYSLISSRVPAYGISPGYLVCVSNRCQGLGLVGGIQWDRTNRLFGFGPSQVDVVLIKSIAFWIIWRRICFFMNKWRWVVFWDPICLAEIWEKISFFMQLQNCYANFPKKWRITLKFSKYCWQIFITDSNWFPALITNY